MSHFLKIVMFSLLMIGLFTAYSNYGIPAIQPEPPPVQEALDLSNVDMESFIVLGEQLYNGKGACPLCHTAVGGRAPMLDELDAVIASRLDIENYQGNAKSFEEYVTESMVDPSAYVVPGFGKLGAANESPMPSVTAGSIGLSAQETAAITAYLQEINGLAITVKIPGDIPAVVVEKEQPTSATPATSSRAMYQSGDEIITALGCGACHTIGAFQSPIGPDLSSIGSMRDKEHIRNSILNPNLDITEGYAPMMPPIYGDQLYASELELLVNYMSDQK